MVHRSWFIVAGTGLGVQGFIGFGTWVSGLGFKVSGLVLGVRLVTCSFGLRVGAWDLSHLAPGPAQARHSRPPLPCRLPKLDLNWIKFGFDQS